MMANPSKQKGTRAETEVARLLNRYGWNAQRVALHGARDCGDIQAEDGLGAVWTIEVKAGKQTVDYTERLREEWLDQAQREAANASEGGAMRLWALVVRKHGRPIGDAHVWVGRNEFYTLDEWAAMRSWE